MVVGDSAVSLQYHVEADAPMLPTWCESENARAKLDKVFGDDGLSHFQRAALAELPDLKKHARAVFGNWMKRVAPDSVAPDSVAPDRVTPGLAAR